jgi:hypothetical protein
LAVSATLITNHKAHHAKYRVRSGRSLIHVGSGNLTIRVALLHARSDVVRRQDDFFRDSTNVNFPLK